MIYSFQSHEELDSTNRLAHELAKNGAPEGTVITARYQTQGRGRLGRSFFSPKGTGLYMSLILRPSVSPQELLLITTAAAVAVARAAETLTGEGMRIKWVNDVYRDGKKVAGILTEGAFGGETVTYAILGIGVNIAPPVGGFPADIAQKAGTLFDTPCDKREELSHLILQHFEEYYGLLTDKPFLEEYRRRSLLDGKTVQLLNVDDTPRESATVLGIDDDFALIVRTENGIRHLTSGDVSIQL